MALLHPAAKARVVGSVDSSVRAAVVSFHQKKISSIENILLDLCAIFSIAVVESEFELRPKGECGPKLRRPGPPILPPPNATTGN